MKNTFYQKSHSQQFAFQSCATQKRRSENLKSQSPITQNHHSENLKSQRSIAQKSHSANFGSQNSSVQKFHSAPEYFSLAESSRLAIHSTRSYLTELSSLTDDLLLKHLTTISASERKIYNQVIEALEEVERRKLYLKRGYSNLFQFCTQYLKYSAGAAQRRINSMRLVAPLSQKQKEVVKEKIEKGSLNLTHLDSASRFIHSEKKKLSGSEKIQLLKTLENTSQQECQGALAQMSVQPVRRREVFHMQSKTEARLTINLDAETLQMLQEFIDLTAHRNPMGSKEKAIKLALKLALQKINPLKKSKQGEGAEKVCLENKANASKGKRTLSTQTHNLLKLNRSKNSTPLRSEKQLKDDAMKTAAKNNNAGQEGAAKTTKDKTKKQSRYIPIQIKKTIWKRDQGRCTYKDMLTNKKCESTYKLELDHIHEFSKGGEARIENLRLLCANHNRHRNKIES